MLNFKLTAEETNRMKKYLGFGTYKELYVYLSTFPIKRRYVQRDLEINREDVIYLFKNEKMIDEVIEKNLQAVLPRWMNREEFVYEIRRRFPEVLLSRKISNDKKFDIGMKHLFDRLNMVTIEIPGLFYENAKNYDDFKF